MPPRICAAREQMSWSQTGRTLPTAQLIYAARCRAESNEGSVGNGFACVLGRHSLFVMIHF